MSSISKDPNASILKSFKLERVLNEDLAHHSINLLGTIEQHPEIRDRDTKNVKSERAPAIILLVKTPLRNSSRPDHVARLVENLAKVESLGSNDVYRWYLAWAAAAREDEECNADYKVTVIMPATETHIRKYSRQAMKMIKETSETYEKIVKAYIDQIPDSRLTWLRNILSHKSETEKIIYEDLSATTGFMVMPDLKWDQQNTLSLYVLAIVRDPSIRSLRNITPAHLPLLKAIANDGTRAVHARYGVPSEQLRLFVHYQPSYYQFHVHIVHVQHVAFPGVATGQAHLLDDIIETLEQEHTQQPSPARSHYARRTFTYSLGENHEMFEKLWKATTEYHETH